MLIVAPLAVAVAGDPGALLKACASAPASAAAVLFCVELYVTAGLLKLPTLSLALPES
jgi:hypothetical protein